jgi:ABC-type multidrug transport system permease subunit
MFKKVLVFGQMVDIANVFKHFTWCTIPTTAFLTFNLDISVLSILVTPTLFFSLFFMSNFMFYTTVLLIHPTSGENGPAPWAFALELEAIDDKLSVDFGVNFEIVLIFAALLALFEQFLSSLPQFPHFPVFSAAKLRMF